MKKTIIINDKRIRLTKARLLDNNPWGEDSSRMSLLCSAKKYLEFAEHHRTINCSHTIRILLSSGIYLVECQECKGKSIQLTTEEVIFDLFGTEEDRLELVLEKKGW